MLKFSQTNKASEYKRYLATFLEQKLRLYFEEEDSDVIAIPDYELLLEWLVEFEESLP